MRSILKCMLWQMVAIQMVLTYCKQSDRRMPSMFVNIETQDLEAATTDIIEEPRVEHMHTSKQIMYYGFYLYSLVFERIINDE